MPIKVVCTSCEAGLRVADAAAGKKIKCPKCGTVNRVPADEAVVEAPLPAAARSKARASQDDADDEAPARRDGKKRKGSKNSGRSKSKSNKGLLIGLAVGGAALVIVIAVVLVLLNSSSDAKQQPTKPVASNAPERKTTIDDEPVNPEPQKPPPQPQKSDNVQFPVWRPVSQNNLRNLALAMHIYHDDHKGFPYTKPGAPGNASKLSWRVAILPFIEQNSLYEQFKLDEAWDSPHNKQVLETRAMPALYASPAGEMGEEKKTYYQVITGPGTAWLNANSRPRLQTFSDGLTNTFLIVEAKTPVFWTQPEDVVYDGKTVPPLGGIFNGSFHAAMGDKSIVYIQRGTLSDETIRALITPNGGETITENFRK